MNYFLIVCFFLVSTTALCTETTMGNLPVIGRINLGFENATPKQRAALKELLDNNRSGGTKTQLLDDFKIGDSNVSEVARLIKILELEFVRVSEQVMNLNFL